MTLMAWILNIIVHLMIYCYTDNSACDSNNTNGDSDDSIGEYTYSTGDNCQKG